MGFDRQKADFLFNTLDNQTPAMDILETQFGVPSCATDLAGEVLALFPSSPLESLSKSIQAGKKAAQDYIKEQKRKLFLQLGIIEAKTANGMMTLTSNLSDSVLGGGFLGSLGSLVGMASEVWDTVTGIVDKVQQIANCIDQLSTHESLKSNHSALASKYANFGGFCKINGRRNADHIDASSCEDAGGVWIPGVDPDKVKEYREDLDAKYAVERKNIINALAFVTKSQEQLNIINEILNNRYLDPDNYPEPCFDGSVYVESQGKTVAEILEGTGFCVRMPGQGGYCSLGTQYKDKQACEDAGGRWTVDEEKLPQEKFWVKPERLDPPISTKEKFILTRTGIYYDSVNGGIDLPSNLEDIVECESVIPEASLRWMYLYNPNCGGKGESVSLKEFNKWANTIFDIENTELENDPKIKEYYNKDRFLTQIQGERNRRVYDTSSYIKDLLVSGYAEDSALVSNAKQNVNSTIETYENKINRRKKQIQIAVVLGGAEIGKVPVNDFSFLDNTQIKIHEKAQSRLAFLPGEVSSVVLPLKIASTIKKDTALKTVYINHLHVPTTGRGSIISSASSVTSTQAPVVSLTDNIVTTDLISCYNFLGANVESKPDSINFSVENTADTGTSYNAQIVASSFDTVYPSGVGIAQFKGICSFFSGTNTKASYYLSPPSAQYLQSPYNPLSYMRLPQNINDFESLLYKREGFTLDCWIHVPTLMTSSYDGWDTSLESSSMHRILLGNENRGGDKQVTDAERMEIFQDYDSVKGLLVGFTRDRRFTKNLPLSNDTGLNPVDSDLKFYMAPTRSINTSSITFIPKASLDCFANTTDPQRYLGAVLDVTGPTGTTSALGDCSSTFKHLSITCDPSGDGRVAIYSDGVEVLSQNYVNTFGFTGPPNIPSPVDSSSFSYTNLYENSLPKGSITYIPSAVYQGDFWRWNAPGAAGFTPWIIGGGYTDGMTNKEFGYSPSSDSGMNFLGSKDGGLRSGFNGMVGSLKLYKRALNSAEVLKNFNAQKGFFKNIQT
jgi:hypothetical protein